MTVELAWSISVASLCLGPPCLTYEGEAILRRIVRRWRVWADAAWHFCAQSGGRGSPPTWGGGGGGGGLRGEEGDCVFSYCRGGGGGGGVRVVVVVEGGVCNPEEKAVF